MTNMLPLVNNILGVNGQDALPVAAVPPAGEGTLSFLIGLISSLLHLIGLANRDPALLNIGDVGPHRLYA